MILLFMKYSNLGLETYGCQQKTKSGGLRNTSSILLFCQMPYNTVTAVWINSVIAYQKKSLLNYKCMHER